MNKQLQEAAEAIYNDKVAHWFAGQIGSADIKEDVIEAMQAYADAANRGCVWVRADKKLPVIDKENPRHIVFVNDVNHQSVNIYTGLNKEFPPMIRHYIHDWKWLDESSESSPESVNELVEALEKWDEATNNFHTGYKNIDGKTTRCDISTLSLECNHAENNLKRALSKFKEK